MPNTPYCFFCGEDIATGQAVKYHKPRGGYVHVTCLNNHEEDLKRVIDHPNNSRAAKAKAKATLERIPSLYGDTFIVEGL